MYILAEGIWFTKLIRQFFYSIDKVIYNFIPAIYDLLISIARTSVLTQADILDMADRIYKLLAVFMVFKVTFSLIMYVVNPDDFSDKSKGVSKLAFNVGISLALLVLTPYIFSNAYRLQSIILEDNAIATLVFGNEGDDEFFNTAGDKMAFITIRPFFSPNTSLYELRPCGAKYDQECIDSMARLVGDNFNMAMLNTYTTGMNYKSVGLMFRQNIALATTDKSLLADGQEFVIDYKIIFSTVIGVVIVLILIGYCMDVALRSIKLAFLQLVAPIPILSFVDPKSGKDGLFKKWWQMCLKTYLSLFIRLIALYFAVYIIGRVADMSIVDIVDGSYISNAYISIFIIIGALMFAKQLPKILEGLGIKLDGDNKFTLNPLKKFEEQALGGKKILGFGAAAAAAGTAGLVNFGGRTLGMFNKKNWQNKDGRVTFGSVVGGLSRPFTSAIAGTTSAAYRGSKKAMRGEKLGKTFTDSYGEAMFAKLQREDLTRKGSTFIGRRAADFHRLTGTLNAAQNQTLEYGNLEQEYKNNTDEIKHKQEVLKRNREQKTKILADKDKALSAIDNRINTTKIVKDAQDKVDSLRSSGRYFATAGTLNFTGKAAQDDLNNKKQEYKNEEEKISEKISLNNMLISDMKKSGTYYKKDENGAILKMAGGNPILTEEAQIAENELRSNTEQLNNIIDSHKEDIATREEDLRNNESYRYKSGELTEEGSLAKDELDREKLNAFKNLIETDAEVKAYMTQLQNTDKELRNNFTEAELEEYNLKTNDYIAEDGSFNRGAMFETKNIISAISAKDYPTEAMYAEQLRDVQNKFEEVLQSRGLDKDSSEWKANEADNAHRNVKNPQPEGWMPSPSVNNRSYLNDPRLSGRPPMEGFGEHTHTKHK